MCFFELLLSYALIALSSYLSFLCFFIDRCNKRTKGNAYSGFFMESFSTKKKIQCTFFLDLIFLSSNDVIDKIELAFLEAC